MSVTAIVLAGGRSTRFGEDKLAAPLDGLSVLAATLEAVSGLADRVIVAGPALPAGFQARGVPVVLIADREPYRGPFAALAHVLESCAQRGPDDLAIVVGGDMPRVVPAVLRAMLDRLGSDRSSDAVLLERSREGEPSDPDDRPMPRPVLPLGLRIGPAVVAARVAVTAGDRALQALVDRLAHVDLPAAAWLPLDPEARTLTDVDTKGDLARLRRPDVR